MTSEHNPLATKARWRQRMLPPSIKLAPERVPERDIASFDLGSSILLAPTKEPATMAIPIIIEAVDFILKQPPSFSIRSLKDSSSLIESTEIAFLNSSFAAFSSCAVASLFLEKRRYNLFGQEDAPAKL